MSKPLQYYQSPPFSSFCVRSKMPSSSGKISFRQSVVNTKLGRRAGIVSRKKQYLCKGDFIESGKSIKRNMIRRYAITEYSKMSHRYDLSLRCKEAYKDDDSRRVYYFQDDISKNDKVFVFDENDDLDLNVDTSEFFISLMILYYKDAYTVNSSDTHKRIMQATILSDLKVKGYRFLKKCLLHPGKLFVCDDAQSMLIIKSQLKVQGAEIIH